MIDCIAKPSFSFILTSCLIVTACGSEAENSRLNEAIQVTKEAASNALNNVKESKNKATESIEDKTLEVTRSVAKGVVVTAKESVGNVDDKAAFLNEETSKEVKPQVIDE